MKNPLLDKIINIALYECVWFACVLGKNQVGLPVTLVAIAIHFGLLKPRPNEWIMVTATGLGGVFIDSLLMNVGFLQFNGYDAILCPPWLIAIWVGFGITFAHSLSWMAKFPQVAFVLGAIGGPLSYYGAARMGAVEIPGSVLLGAFALGLLWAGLVVLFANFATRLGIAPGPDPLPASTPTEGGVAS